MFDIHQWAQYTRDTAPNKPTHWRRHRLRDITTIKRSVPRTVRHALLRPPPPLEDDEVVLIAHSQPAEQSYALHKTTPQGSMYRLVELDTSGYPHETGTTVTHALVSTVTRVAIWKALNKHYIDPYRGDEEHALPEERSAIIGPTTQAFPLNEGWYIGENPKLESGKDKRLSDLTIHEICSELTARITEGVRPNCEANWNTHLADSHSP